MAKRKSNRAARHTLAQGKQAQLYCVSNRRQMNQTFDDQPGFAWHTKLSASQSRAKCRIQKMRIERNFETNCLAGMNDALAWAEAVKTVKG